MSGSTIQPYSDGPYVVRGEFKLLGEDGEEIELHRGTIALCRCGKSRMKPFCDGTHKLASRARRDAEPATNRADAEPAPGESLPRVG